MFKRAWRLVLARTTPSGYFEVRDEVSIDGLRVVFDVEKSLHGKPNPATITVYNLADESRAFVQGKRVHVKLYAGYEDDAAPLLFTGDVRWAPSNLPGVDWITKIEAADGARAHKHARMSKSYGPGTDYRQILKDGIAGMGLKVPTSIDDARELLTKLTTGFTAAEPSADVIAGLLEHHGMSMSVQDGQAVVLRDDEARPGSAYVVDIETGLLGTPTYAATKKGKHLLTLRTLLRPELSPGRKIKLTSRTANGIFRIERGKYTGDTHGEDWFNDMEVKAL